MVCLLLTIYPLSSRSKTSPKHYSGIFICTEHTYWVFTHIVVQKSNSRAQPKYPLNNNIEVGHSLFFFDHSSLAL